MVKNKKVIIVTPAGRTKCLEILSNHIKKAGDMIDEWHLWVNTTEQSDIDYMEKLASENDFIRLKRVSPDHPMTRDWRQWNLHLFYEYCQEDAVYLRIDDDIVWIDKDAIKLLAIERLENNKPFIIYPNILNNCLMSHLQTRMGNYPLEWGVPQYETYNEISLKSADFFIKAHTQMLCDIQDGNMDKYKYNKWILVNNEHHSITVSAFLNLGWRSGKIGDNDEIQLNIDIPKEIGVFNEVYGKALFVHWQYFYQREDLRNKGLDQDMFLEDYLKLSNI